MDKSYDDIELIESYLECKLSGAELENFEKRKKEDPAFRKMLEDMELMIRGIKQSAKHSLLDDLKELDKSLPEIKIAKAKKSRSQVFILNKQIPTRKLVMRTLAIAASITLLFTLFPFQSPFNKFITPYDEQEHPTLRSEGDIMTEEDKAFSAYKLGDYERAIELLLKIGVDDPNGLLCLGYSYMDEKDYLSARNCFNKITNNESWAKNPSYTFFINEAIWYKAISYLKTQDYDQARELFEKLDGYENDRTEDTKEILKSKKLKPRLK